ncbi:hypothetical protein BDV96DRAFT_352173 [Lophiotrema nucula]|uniref:Uncharacterized protein n=1 Tax=Lophiotrema nucula TaxID=690887 RepID=A0A6A5ZNE9_9PLEO|nr:hypothetical protein BDV96DRAFT_352173 [Lophiotrema nucula]
MGQEWELALHHRSRSIVWKQVIDGHGLTISNQSGSEAPSEGSRMGLAIPAKGPNDTHQHPLLSQGRRSARQNTTLSLSKQCAGLAGTCQHEVNDSCPRQNLPFRTRSSHLKAPALTVCLRLSSHQASRNFSNTLLSDKSNSLVLLEPLIEPQPFLRIAPARDRGRKAQVGQRGCTATFRISNCHPADS